MIGYIIILITGCITGANSRHEFTNKCIIGCLHDIHIVNPLGKQHHDFFSTFGIDRGGHRGVMRID